MPHPGDDLSALFRSFGPDDANFQAATNAAAQEAEQRWPLFKAVSPRKSELTPALSAEEKQRWSSQEKAETGARKPALSLPGLSDKLAKSLNKMSGRTTPDAPTPVARTAPHQRLTESPQTTRQFTQETPSKNRGSLFSRSSPAVPSVALERDEGLGLFQKKSEDPVAVHRDMSGSACADDSLASVFSRLEGKNDVVNKPTNRRSSFSGRLGKR